MKLIKSPKSHDESQVTTKFPCKYGHHIYIQAVEMKAIKHGGPKSICNKTSHS
jgi:hypothetical protein